MVKWLGDRGGKQQGKKKHKQKSSVETLFCFSAQSEVEY